MITGPEVVILCSGLIVFAITSTSWVIWYGRREQRRR